MSLDKDNILLKFRTSILNNIQVTVNEPWLMHQMGWPKFIRNQIYK